MVLLMWTLTRVRGIRVFGTQRTLVYPIIRRLIREKLAVSRFESSRTTALCQPIRRICNGGHRPRSWHCAWRKQRGQNWWSADRIRFFSYVSKSPIGICRSGESAYAADQSDVKRCPPFSVTGGIRKFFGSSNVDEISRLASSIRLEGVRNLPARTSSMV